MCVCVLDEKWFYGSSRRNVRNITPKQEYETEEEAYLPALTVRSGQFVTKVMFMDMIAHPIEKLQFDSKIFLKCIPRSKVVKKKSEHQRFVADRNLNELIKSSNW